MVEGNYRTSDGREKEFALEEGDDTNLMFGMRKSAFTLLRSSFKNDDGETQYEFWVKFPVSSVAVDTIVGAGADDWWRVGRLMVVNGIACEGMLRKEWFPSRRPNGRPGKIKFDSCRTALYSYLSAQSRKYGPYWDNMNYDYDWSERLVPGCNFVGNWTYAGSKEDHSDGNFDLYGYVFWCQGGHGYYFEDPWPYITCSFSPMAKNDLISLIGGSVEICKIVFSGKVAEVREWEIVSNDTPEENTYYVVVENKKGDIVDVKTTHGFGQTVTVNDKEYVVKDDIVIRPGR